MEITTVIFDWAGTTVDFGSNAPVAAFQKAFALFGISPTEAEIRQPMGMQKRAHIEKMLSAPRLDALWREEHGRPFTQNDVDEVYAAFEPALFAVLQHHTVPISGVLETVEELRGQGIKIGSTTGYTAAMMDVVAPAAKKNGYAPDCLVPPDAVGGIGRPYPYMLWRNLEKLGTASIDAVLKVGDTQADIAEGKNAGCRTVGVLKGSNMMGLGEAEFSRLSSVEAAAHMHAAKLKYQKAGADFVIDDMAGLPALIACLKKHGYRRNDTCTK